MDTPFESSSSPVVIGHENRFQSLVEGLSHPVVELREGRIVFLNEAWTRQLGHAVSDSLNRPLSGFVAASHRVMTTPQALDAITDTAAFEIRFLHRDGREFWYEMTLSREAPGLLVGMLYNIDAHRHTADEHHELFRASRRRDAFLAAISHELRTPLTSILGYSQLLGDESLGPVAPRQYEAVAGITEAGHQLLSLIDSVLQYARIPEEAERGLEIEPVELGPLVETVLRPLRAQAEERGVRISSEVRVEAAYPCHRGHVERMLEHLVGNAVKFSRAGGEVTLIIRQSDPAVGLEIQIDDDGPGMDAAVLERAFEPFTQLDEGRARRHGGLGLGLALVKALAELHGGRVTCNSTPGVGSRFSVFLPDRGGRIATLPRVNDPRGRQMELLS